MKTKWMYLTVLIALSVLCLVLVDARLTAQQKPTKAIGSKEEAKWSETTTKAASTPENKKVLDSGKVVTVEGEIVEVSCFLQLGKRGQAHIDCGKDCINNGQPIGIVDSKGELYLLIAEQHDPRRRGEVDIKRTFAPLLAATVRVTGISTEHKGYKAIFVKGVQAAK